MADKTEMLSQITLSAIGAVGKSALVTGEPVFMARIGGTINGVKTKKGADERPFSVCLGQFVAVNSTGENFVSDKLIFPGATGEAIEASARIANKKGEAVDFVIDVFSTPDVEGKPRSPMGFSFTAQSLTEAKPMNRAQALLSGVAASKPIPTGAAKPKAAAAAKNK